MNETVEINHKLMAHVRSHSVTVYPEECCGFLYGQTVEERIEIVSVKSTKNQQAENRSRRYLITPEQFIEAEKFAEELAFELVGVYHSHPDHPPVPSNYDLQQALPNFIYLICGVHGKEVTSSRWWKLSEDGCHFTELEVEENRSKMEVS